MQPVLTPVFCLSYILTGEQNRFYTKSEIKELQPVPESLQVENILGSSLCYIYQ